MVDISPHSLNSVFFLSSSSPHTLRLSLRSLSTESGGAGGWGKEDGGGDGESRRPFSFVPSSPLFGLPIPPYSSWRPSEQTSSGKLPDRKEGGRRGMWGREEERRVEEGCNLKE